MIVVLCLSPAIDVTYRVEHLVRGEVNRVLDVKRRPGGKGLNVARVLDQLGKDSVSLLPLGGANGEWIAKQLKEFDIKNVAIKIAGNTRQALTIFDGEATTVNEPATTLSRLEQEILHRELDLLLADASVLVINGSMPAGLEPGFVADLVQLANSKSVKAIVDVSGGALLEACSAGPYLIKPNQHELFEATGETELGAAVEKLRQLGARNILVSRGEAGAELHLADGPVLRQTAIEKVAGNPTGAGDAMVAALAAGLANDLPPVEFLNNALAAGAAAVLVPVAGEIDLAAYKEFVSKLKEPK